jgi:CHAD domain-containing protein
MSYVRTQLEALSTYDPKARLAEPDAVHRMRVAVRRTRSVLRSYHRILDRSETDALQPELRWLASVLGEVRDLEVLRERFTSCLDGLPDEVSQNREWLDALAEREKSGYRKLNRSLTGARYFALLDALEAMVAHPPYTDRAERDPAKELPKVVNRTWQRLELAYAAAESAPDPLVARHEARKDAKRVRYAAEAAVPALGETAATMARHAERLQEVMGGYQDGVIAQQHLTAAAGKATPQESFTIGVVWGIEEATAQAALREIPAVWQEISELRAAPSK